MCTLDKREGEVGEKAPVNFTFSSSYNNLWVSLMVSQFDLWVFRQSYKKLLIIYYEGRLKTSAQKFCWQSTVFNWKLSNHKELDFHLHYISPPIRLEKWRWLNITSHFLYVLTLNRQHIIRIVCNPCCCLLSILWFLMSLLIFMPHAGYSALESQQASGTPDQDTDSGEDRRGKKEGEGGQKPGPATQVSQECDTLAWNKKEMMQAGWSPSYAG